MDYKRFPSIEAWISATKNRLLEEKNEEIRKMEREVGSHNAQKKKPVRSYKREGREVESRYDAFINRINFTYRNFCKMMSYTDEEIKQMSLYPNRIQDFTDGTPLGILSVMQQDIRRLPAKGSKKPTSGKQM